MDALGRVRAAKLCWMPDRPDHAPVLARVRAIPEGWVRTYGDITPGAPRLAGTVLRRTQEDVPWWRVVRADGTLAQGERQRALLAAEGVPFTPGGRVDLRSARLPEPPD